jgi:nicotinamide-nucleotide amidase
MTDHELTCLATTLGRNLCQRGWMLATAESCTGGWIGAALTAVSGSSTWFDRGFITYSNAAKTEMLGVSPDTLAQHGAVSEATVLAMARGAITRSAAHLAVAVSGIAGPTGGTTEKPVGMVCIAWALADGTTHALTQHFRGDRDAVRRQTVIAAIEGAIRLAPCPHPEQPAS